MSQEELALRAGIDRSYMGSVERGEQNIGVMHLVAIAEALGVSVVEIATAAAL
ncbi:helix-turn-helix transcriptional regulator [Cupriavidus malaysiensis]